MEKKGQGALEYLLLIGGAVLIAVIVIAVVTGLANTAGTNVGASATCPTLTGCGTCKANLTCQGFRTDGTSVFVVPRVGGVCSAAEQTGFSYCKQI